MSILFLFVLGCQKVKHIFFHEGVWISVPN